MQYLALFALVLLGLFLSGQTALAGQGGGNDAGGSSPVAFIIGGLVVVLLASGVGLVMARRKKQ